MSMGTGEGLLYERIARIYCISHTLWSVSDIKEQIVDLGDHSAPPSRSSSRMAILLSSSSSITTSSISDRIRTCQTWVLPKWTVG